MITTIHQRLVCSKRYLRLQGSREPCEIFSLAYKSWFTVYGLYSNLTKVHIIFNIKLCKYFYTNDTICCHWITPAGWRCEGRNITVYIISLLLTLARSSCLVFGRSIKMLLKQGRGTKHKQIGRLTCQVLKREVWKTYFEKLEKSYSIQGKIHVDTHPLLHKF